MDKKKLSIGVLSIIILSTFIYVQFENVRIKIHPDNTIVQAPNPKIPWFWINIADERNSIWDGTTKMNRRLNETYIYYENTTEIFTGFRNTQYIRGPRILDTYRFAGNIKSVEEFPVEHKIEIFDALDDDSTPFIYQWEVRGLEYSGETKDITGNSMEFGNNVKVTWDDGYYWAKVYKTGIIKVRWRITSDYFVLYNRVYDPVAITNEDYEVKKYGNIIEVSFPKLDKIIDLSTYLNPEREIKLNLTHHKGKADVKLYYYENKTKISIDEYECNCVTKPNITSKTGKTIICDTCYKDVTYYDIELTEVTTDKLRNIKINNKTKFYEVFEGCSEFDWGCSTWSDLKILTDIEGATWFNSTYTYARNLTIIEPKNLDYINFPPNVDTNGYLVDASGWTNKPYGDSTYNRSLVIVNTSCNNGGTEIPSQIRNITTSGNYLDSFNLLFEANSTSNDTVYCMYYASTDIGTDTNYTDRVTKTATGADWYIESEKYYGRLETGSSGLFSEFKRNSSANNFMGSDGAGNGIPVLYESGGGEQWNMGDSATSASTPECNDIMCESHQSFDQWQTSYYMYSQFLMVIANGTRTAGGNWSIGHRGDAGLWGDMTEDDFVKWSDGTTYWFDSNVGWGNLFATDISNPEYLYYNDKTLTERFVTAFSRGDSIVDLERYISGGYDGELQWFGATCCDFDTYLTTNNHTVFYTFTIDNASADNLGEAMLYPIFIESIGSEVRSDTCSCPASGDWEIDCSDDCNITSSCDMMGNDIYINGSGNFLVNADVINWTLLRITGVDSTNRCIVKCETGCFKN